MGKTSYRNMKELVDELSARIDELQQGKLGMEELETAVSNSRELYERLLIVRYKALEQYAKGEEVVVHAEEEVLVEEKTVEVEEEKVEEIEESKEDNIQPTFDFSLDMNTSEEEERVEVTEEVIEEEEAETELVEEETEVVEEEIEEEVIAEEEKEEGIATQNEDEVSLNDKLGDGELSLRKKLQSSPVTDLNSEISIAKKFEYISNMFDGNNDEYNQAIQVLNSCNTGDEARAKLNEYSSKFNWNLEDKSIIKFVELVERRYL
ncbi:MAG: hypothetical protein MI810_03995 [Flavobacteriales bacterium]|nr:hypothetical protein [Flavobacteriales bacterium]